MWGDATDPTAGPAMVPTAKPQSTLKTDSLKILNAASSAKPMVGSDMSAATKTNSQRQQRTQALEGVAKLAIESCGA